MADCPLCSNTGFMPVMVADGSGRMARAMKPCVCRTRQRAEREKQQPGGFERIGEGLPRAIDEMCRNPLAKMVREIILAHRGEQNPVTVREIAQKLWPEDAATPAHERAVKQMVSDLTTLAGMLIGSSRDPKKPGYFLIETADELDRQRTHCLHHLRAWARRFKALDPDGSAARELYGQLREELEDSAA